MTKVKPLNDDANVTYEPLLDPESSLFFFLSEPAISTISFFDRNVDLERSRAWLKERLGLICAANPWLAGRLVRKKKMHRNVLLATPTPATDNDVEALLGGDEDGVLANMSHRTRYETLYDALSKANAVVGPGYKLVGKDKRCAKFSLVEMAEGQVALIVSITHAVADGEHLISTSSGWFSIWHLSTNRSLGYTYYKIMSMLERKNNVTRLSPKRKHEFFPKSKEAIGAKEFKFLLSVPFAVCCVRSMLFGPKARLGAQFVDAARVRERKEEAAETKAEDGFVSTNDLLVSAFSRAARADVLLMAINLRGRVEGTDAADAGNYSSVVLHDADSAASPEGVRRSLAAGPPFLRRGGRPLPGALRTMTRTRAAMITNWAFPDFEATVSLPDAAGAAVPLDLHLPVPYNPREIVFPIAVVFKPRKGKLGFLYGGAPGRLSHEDLAAVGAPLGEQICNEMFANE